MGLSQSKKSSSNAQALVASPGPAEAIPSSPSSPMARSKTPSSTVELNTTLNDTAILFSQDADWLDESEMRAMEDEDAVLVRELSATPTGDLNLADWVKSREQDTRMVIKIVEMSKLSKFMGRKTVEYTIQTDTGSVKRRYKDFVALRYGLEVRFPGAVVPPLPPKKQFGNKTEPALLKKRKRMLAFFLQTVARHPFLSGDDLFVEFIASATKFDRKTAVKPRVALVKAQKWSVAARRWAQALIEAETPSNPYATMEAALEEVAANQKCFGSLKNALKKSFQATTALSDALQEVSFQFHKAAALENSLLQLSASPTAASAPLTKTYEETKTRTAQHAEALVKMPDLTDEALLSPIRYEMAFVETFTEALKRAKFSMQRHRQAVSAYRQARDQSELANKSQLQLAVQAEIPQDGGGAPSPPQTAQLMQSASTMELEKQRKRLQRLRHTAVQAQMNARRDINGVLALELQRFRAERQDRMNAALSQLVAVNSTQAHNLATIWGAAVASFASMPVSNAHREDAPLVNGDSFTDANNNSSFMEGDYNLTRRASQLRAKYPFQGMHEDELDVAEGDVLEGDVDQDNPEWVRVTHLATGKSGLVPKTYVEEVDEDGAGEENGEAGGEGGNDSSNLYDGPSTDKPDPTNVIKQTQDLFNKGTKRSNADREDA